MRWLRAKQLDCLGALMLSTQMLGTLLEEIRRTIMDPFAGAAIRLLLLTGCRLREILHLRWEHVDTERGLIFLPDAKGGAADGVP